MPDKLSSIIGLFLLTYCQWLSAIDLFGNTDSPLLQPQLAFAALATAAAPNTIRVEYAIADGYYLYRDKLAFSVDHPQLRLGTPDLPPGKMIEDDYFGAVEIYRKQLILHIPIAHRPEQAFSFTLSAKSQGCADIGVCYQPFTQTVSLALPAVVK